MGANTFHKLSTVLTGEGGLDVRLSVELEQRVRAHYPIELQALLDAYAAAGAPASEPEVLKVLDKNGVHHRVAREIIRVWYTGQFETPYEGIDVPRTPEQWEAGLLWKVIRAPAPGFSKNPYGVWANKPVE